jgi:two-component system phosphate regulon response regulator PhoB
MSKHRILVVEDDQALASVLHYNLRQAGFDVLSAADGNDGYMQARRFLPDVVVLDLMIPGIDGMEVCRRMRAADETRQIPVIMLTARSAEADQLGGFAAGADDYVTKPFSVKVLLQRIQAIQRRKLASEGVSDVVTNKGITVDRLKHRVLLDDQVLDLTPSEFRLIDTMIRQSGRAFDRSELIDSALGGDALVLERTIDVHIRSLRKKLGDRADVIETVRGVGYRFHG